MVIEMLTFAIDPTQRDAWLAKEERVWSRFLERQPGFVRQEMWVSAGDDDEVHAVIWWESMQAWKAISAEAVAAVDEQMGEWFREPSMRAFHVLREC